MNASEIKTFCVLFFALLTTVTGVGIVVPLLPVYARDIGASGFYIGMIFGIFSISRTAFIPYFGRSSDRRGRKPFILWGLLGYAAVAAAFCYTTSVAMLITIRFFQGIFSAMMMPVLQAYVGDITPDGREGFTMGVFNVATFVGLGMGPLLGGVISDRWNLQAAFASMGLLALIGFGLSLFGLPPVRHEKAFRHDTAPVAWRQLLRDREVVGLFAFRMTYTTCIGVIWGFLPIYADQSLHLSRSAIGALIMTGVMVSGNGRRDSGRTGRADVYLGSDRHRDAAQQRSVRVGGRDCHAGPDGNDRQQRRPCRRHGSHHGPPDPRS